MDYLQQIENIIKNAPADQLRKYETQIKIYATKLYHNNDFTKYINAEYILAKITDELIIRRVRAESNIVTGDVF